MNHERLYEIMSGQAKSVGPAATRLGLSVLSPGYRLAICLRNRMFDKGLRKITRLERPVISVGNITTGGTGKTPMVIELARQLTVMDQKPAVLLRGYMAGNSGAETSSDEAVELANELGSAVPVEANPDRVEGARRVLNKHPETTVFLMDDGFQHRQVHRDLDIVLIDATRPFGFGRLLPRGLLREPARNLRRADAVILTRCELLSPMAMYDLDRQIEALANRPPQAHTIPRWSGFRGESGIKPADYLDLRRVTGACAIGNPEAFVSMLENTAGEVLEMHRFNDHHRYTEHEIHNLLNEAKCRGADAVVITEKDWVKWRPLVSGLDVQGTLPPVLRPILGVRFLDGAEAVESLLKQALQPHSD